VLGIMGRQYPSQNDLIYAAAAENTGWKIQEASNRAEGPMCGIGAATAGGGSGSSLSLAA
jgi:hypothetical protein